MSRLIRSFFRTWRDHLGVQIATLSVLSGTFTVISVFVLLQDNLTQVISRWGEGVQLAVYIKDEAEAEQIQKIRETLQSIEGLEKVEFVSKDMAVTQFLKQMGPQAPKLLTDPEFGNPLPASFEVHFSEAFRQNRGLDQLVVLAQKLMNISGVEDVSYGQGWIENYASLIRVFSSSSYVLILLLLAGSLLVVGNTIRNSIHQRRDEIEIMELVGATAWSVRAPFVFEGAVLGLLASLSALGVTWGLLKWFQSVTAEGLHFWQNISQVSFLNATQIIGLILLGVWFGIMGSYFCVRRLATGWSAAERQ